MSRLGDQDLDAIERAEAERHATYVAMFWLIAYLTDGPKPAPIVLAAGLLAGQHRRDVYGAKTILKVASEKRPDGHFYWSLPDDPKSPGDDPKSALSVECEIDTLKDGGEPSRTALSVCGEIDTPLHEGETPCTRSEPIFAGLQIDTLLERGETSWSGVSGPPARTREPPAESPTFPTDEPCPFDERDRS